ncbi:MAG TPA: sugar ABC transporter substrate-binding protein [Polyangiaceae bacterium]|nr:sugar ABC transporter substrate-binding protein [Polyangiaceae bacterium]
MAPPRVGLFLHDGENDYQQLMLQDAEQAARRHSLQLDVHVAGKDVDRQINQLKVAISAQSSARPELILVSPVREQLLLTLLRSAARAGIHWAFLTRWLDDIPALRREFPEVDIYSVSADQKEIGRLQGRQLDILRGPEDELIYLSGPAGTSSARQRAEGIQPELERARGKCQTFYGDWSQESGRAAARRWLAGFPKSQRPSFVIIGQNDNMAVGAREAVAASLDSSRGAKLRVIGCDGSFSFGQRLVSQGKLSATVVVPPVSGRAVDAFAQRLAGRGRPNAVETVAVASHPSLEALRTKHVRLRL